MSLSLSSSSSEKKDKEVEEPEVVDGEVKDDAPAVTQHVLLALAQSLFLLSSHEVTLDSEERKSLMQSILTQIEQDDMSGLYEYLEDKRLHDPAYKYLTDSGWTFSSSKLAEMKIKNAGELVAADVKIKEAMEIAGDTEVREALFTRANLHAKWGCKDSAFEEYSVVLEKTVGIASKLDVLLAKLRIALAFLDTKNAQGDPNLRQFKQDLEKAKMSVANIYAQMRFYA